MSALFSIQTKQSSPKKAGRVLMNIYWNVSFMAVLCRSNGYLPARKEVFSSIIETACTNSMTSLREFERC